MRRTLQRNPHMRRAPHHDDADFAQDEGVRAYLCVCVCVSVCSSRTRLVLEGCENSVVCCGRACRRFIYAFVCVCVSAVRDDGDHVDTTRNKCKWRVFRQEYYYVPPRMANGVFFYACVCRARAHYCSHTFGRAVRVCVCVAYTQLTHTYFPPY